MMALTARSHVSAQPLPGGDAAGTMTIEVEAELLMVTPEWVRRLTKTVRGRYRVVGVARAARALKGASAMRPSQVASDEAP